MTWSARFKVQDVSDGPAPIDVLAIAEGDDVTSNTEGPIRSIELKLVIDADETGIAVGDEISATGHFLS